MVHFSNILMVLKDPRFMSCERIYTIDFSLFLKIKSLDMLVSVYQKLLGNILDAFCMAQIWYDLSVLRMFTVVECRGHTNFDLSKIYEGYFQVT